MLYRIILCLLGSGQEIQPGLAEKIEFFHENGDLEDWEYEELSAMLKEPSKEAVEA